MTPHRAIRVRAAAKLPSIAVPGKRDVAALGNPAALARWQAGIRAAGDVGANVITMYDVIGEDFWSGGGVTVNRVDAALRRIGNQPVEVHINSPGGDMFEGIAILNRLMEHPAEVTVKVLGLAASAASIVAMAGEKIMIGPASFLMIHNCWILAMGDRNEMARMSEWLTPFDAAMAGVYAARTKQAEKAVAGWMDSETWMNGQLAIDRGFADSLLQPDDLVEDPKVTEDAAAANSLRQAEINLCRGGCTRTEARELLNKIKGTPGAAQPSTPGAGDHTWLAAARQLTESFRS